MANRGAPGSRAAEPLRRSGRGYRETFQSRESNECQKAINALDPDTKALIRSDLQEFTKRWKQTSNDEDLRKSRFTYKPLSGRECREAKLNEIYVGHGKYRVAITVVVYDETVWFVYCFKKGKADQKQGITRSVRIAQDIRKGN
jgi:hypothetical protein